MASRDPESAAYSSGAKSPRRLNDGVKQRIVGALVLAALAVIFLPSLFDREGVRYIDVTSQIPPAPDIEPIVIAEPTPVADIEPAPPVNEVFQPEFVEQSGTAPDPDAPLNKPAEPVAEAQDPEPEARAAPKPSPQVAAKEEIKTAKPAATDKAEPAKSALDEYNLPEGWVVQVGAYREAASAERMRAKLLDAGFRAYTRAVDTQNGRLVRVFVGPKLDKADAQSDKGKLDKLLNAQTLVLRYKA
ncbi:SPOR domain-containing protein [uncultured Microbulbifer sp.]|uniref:SPOR domain-containing protein n=1 Tax=uncultured Microbulbifer sp. TaxID=348147 RepID=UPI0025D44DE6|nr:SPOR domain-containing protein [uncultured Microbulbifer sp.]